MALCLWASISFTINIWSRLYLKSPVSLKVNNFIIHKFHFVFYPLLSDFLSVLLTVTKSCWFKKWQEEVKSGGKMRELHNFTPWIQSWPQSLNESVIVTKA